MNWTQEQYEEYLRKAGRAAPAQAKRRSKYNARRVWVDGIPFDSQREADYYASLKLLVRAGALDGFLYHGSMVCTEGAGQEHRAVLYETDFVLLHPGGTYEIVDTKGVRTPVYINKRKALRERYPRVKIKEE